MVKSDKITVFDIALVAILTALLFAQEQLLTNIPGVQLTVFLIILYSKVLGLTKTSIIVIIHVLLDNIFISSVSLVYTPTMLVGWLLIPITINTIFKKANSALELALLAILYSLIYSWLFVIPTYFILNVNPVHYIMSDILFEIILASFSFLTTLWLYEPCSKAMRQFLGNKTTN